MESAFEPTTPYLVLPAMILFLRVEELSVKTAFVFLENVLLTTLENEERFSKALLFPIKILLVTLALDFLDIIPMSAFFIVNPLTAVPLTLSKVIAVPPVPLMFKKVTPAPAPRQSVVGRV